MKRGTNKIIRIMKKLTFYNLLKGLRYLRHFGLKEFLVRLSERMEPEEVEYSSWRLKKIPDEKEVEKQKKRIWKKPIKISILVPAYKTPPVFLKQMIESVQNQTYQNWELCILNASPTDKEMKQILESYGKKDKRIRYKMWGENKGISENTNEALSMASGDFVGLLDHDDLLEINALYEVALALESDKDIEVVYTDEDKVTTDLLEYFQPHLKPDFNLDLLRSNNYICHFFVVKRELANRLGGFRPAYDGAQDYDFIFRCVREAKKIHHIAEILYHWRVHKASTADNPASKMYAFEAGKRAIEDDLKMRGERGQVFLRKDLGFYRVEYTLEENSFISIIIPNKDEKESLETCISSIEESSYKNYEIIIVENNSSTKEIFDYYEILKKKKNIKIVTYEGAFNYSKINNFGAAYAGGDYLLFLNNDTKVIAKNWMELMLSNCQRKDVAIVGAKLYYPDDTIQHAGTI
ncbi:MAG TPA: glycosyltransferase, partial [Lachnospiraceae bacterium]